jgi:hypothetical protein
MGVCAILLLLLSCTVPSSAAESEAFPDLNLNDPASLQEASRVLEEELKLASRPNTYLVIDLVTQSVHIKARGVALYHIPIVWAAVENNSLLTGMFRVTARPAVVRRKIDPGSTVEQEPISLADMPTYYELSCSPDLTLTVLPTAKDHPLRWLQASGHQIWRQLKQWGRAWLLRDSNSPRPFLELTLSAEHAQSLAWSLVDGMPVVIRRATDK